MDQVSKHDDDTCPHLVRASLLEAENARLKAEVERLTAIVGADAIDREHGMCCDSSSEIARLKAEVERLGAFRTHTIIPNEMLKAEVERLTKAGDYLADHIAHEFGTCPSIEIWDAAKEGKPHA